MPKTFIISTLMFMLFFPYSYSCAQSIVNIDKNPDKDTIIIGSKPEEILIFARTNQHYDLQWNIKGPGSLKGKKTDPGIIYIPPLKIDGKEQETVITVTVIYKEKVKEIKQVKFQLRNPSPLKSENKQQQNKKKQGKNEKNKQEFHVPVPSAPSQPEKEDQKNKWQQKADDTLSDWKKKWSDKLEIEKESLSENRGRYAELIVLEKGGQDVGNDIIAVLNNITGILKEFESAYIEFPLLLPEMKQEYEWIRTDLKIKEKEIAKRKNTHKE